MTVNDSKDNDSVPETGAAGSTKKPSEFAGFMRDTFIQALDFYAASLAKKGSKEGEKRAAKPIRKIADHWLDLKDDQKARFFEQVIGAAEVAIAAAPVALATLRGKKKDASKAAAPAKPKAKAKAKAKPKAKAKAKAPAAKGSKRKSTK